MNSPSRGRRGRRLIAVATVIATGALIPVVGSGTIRAELWDSAGSRTVETIDWAYGLK
ncbi:hypothetical protein [Streptomyces sp. NBC_00236]|uniref:hypothetical protein n=1 Tax=Streptomyces sp. NBC_00236 TaxID=2903639 RepID=UPI002E28FEF9|nr:hypothetical protein [Streptomyces sp. NBC_00236]